MTTLTNTIELTKDCSLCNTSHTWTIPASAVDCGECNASPHGSSHEPFTRGHRPHCTGNCCF